MKKYITHENITKMVRNSCRLSPAVLGPCQQFVILKHYLPMIPLQEHIHTVNSSIYINYFDIDFVLQFSFAHSKAI